MKKLKLSLLAVSAVCAVAASAMAFTTVAAADDDYRNVTLNGTNVFYTGVDAASIATVRLDDDSEDGYTDYTAFHMSDGQSVTFRKNLAYNWWEADENGYGVNKKFEMTIGFEDISFSSYVIGFQSQQYNITEDGVSDNYLVFKPSDGALELYISESEEVAEDEEPSVVLEDYSSITVAFGQFADGDYSILVNGEEEGLFVNVRENYASYVSSGDSAATPITFTVHFDESAADDAAVDMIMYSLNGQSFEVFDAEYDDEGALSGGTIHDDKAPVVCLDTGLNYLTYGDEVDIDYTVIDVIASSPRSTVKYYVLTNASTLR